MIRRKAVLARLAFALVWGATAMTAACHHHHHHARHEGPVEHAGRHVDNAADTAGDVIEDTGRTINRALPGD